MSETRRSIGGEGLEQGGMELGNDISRKDLSTKDAGDALTNLPTMGDGDEEQLEDDELDLDDDSLLADDEIELDEDEEEEEDKNL